MMLLLTTKQGDYSTAFGSSTIALGDYSTAFGNDTEASGTGATAWGNGTKANGQYSTAFGSSTIALGDYSTAFGNGSVANASNSLAASVAIGTGATVGGAYDSENQQTEGANAFAFGNGAQATLSDSVALGSGAVANRAKYNASNNAYKAYLNEDDSKTNSAWRATHNAIAVGSDDTSNPVTRQIIGVAAGSADTDAVNVAQLKAATFNMQGITRTRSENDNDGYTYTTTIEDKLSVSSNGAFSISGDKFTVTITGTLNAGDTTVSALTVGTKNRTTELITDGVIAEGETGAGYVTGGTVYAVTNALSERIGTVEADGYYIKKSADKNISQNLILLDEQVKTNADAITTTGITFTADNTGTTSGAIKLGGTLAVKGDSNITTEASAGTLTVKLNNSINLGNAGSMTIGDATLTTSGLSVGNTNVTSTGLSFTGSNTSITSAGINAGGNKITGVAMAESDTDAVNFSQLKSYVSSVPTADGRVVTGKGLKTVDESETVKEFQVNAGAGLTFDGSALIVNTGDDLTVDTTDNTLQVKKDGVINANSEGIVTGKTVYAATSVLDSRITTAEGKLTTAEGNITALQTKTQNITASDETTSINGALNAGATTVTSLTDGKATLSGGALAGVTTLTASGAITGGSLNVGTGTISGGMATVTGLTVGTANVTTALKTEGEVKANNAGFVTGGTVYGALQAYQPNGEIKDGNTKAVSGGTVYNVTSALDARIKDNADAIANKADASAVTALSGKVTANETAIATNTSAIQTNTTNIAANKTAIAKNASDIATNKTAIEKNAGDITTLGTKVTANETAIKKNTSDITSLSTKITDNETALSKKADKANTLKGYGIEDAYTKEDTDTLLNKKADKTELEKVKATANSNKKALDALGDVQDLAKDAEAVKKIANDVETVVKEQDGAVAAEGQKDADELVKGSTVYDYLNKGKDGNGKLVLGTESRTITMGKGSETTGDETVTMGFNNQVNGNQNVTIGTKHTVKGDSNTVIGDPDNITGNKNVVLANDTNITGSRNVAIGNNITINGDDTFVMGNNVTANESNAVVLGNGSTAEKDAVSVGSKDGERQIKHVKAGTDPTDAATVGQVQEVAQGAYNNAVYLSNSINKLDNRVNKVGAGAAALAALHPIDTDDKFTMGMGYGNYRSAHAMAMGMFYRPTEKIMISVGGAFGNGENMVNAGSMKKQLDAQGQEIAALKEALARLEAKIGK